MGAVDAHGSERMTALEGLGAGGVDASLPSSVSSLTPVQRPMFEFEPSFRSNRHRSFLQKLSLCAECIAAISFSLVYACRAKHFKKRTLKLCEARPSFSDVAADVKSLVVRQTPGNQCPSAASTGRSAERVLRRGATGSAVEGANLRRERNQWDSIRRAKRRRLASGKQF